jgi:hypothetical protein
MKKLLLFLLALAFTATFITSCQKSDDPTGQDDYLTTSEDLALIQGITEDLDDEIDLQLDGLSGDVEIRTGCPTITSTAPLGTFPNTITIDFGTTGCVGRNGRELKGQMVVTISDAMRNPGATKTVTFVNFFVDDAQVEGTKTFTNNGLNSDGNPCISRTTDKTITFPDGAVATFEGSHQICQIAGIATPRALDDIFTITGSASGTNRLGHIFSSEIITPLVKARNCRFVSAGEMEFTRDGNTSTINFGNGMCDRQATLTLPDGTTRTIILDPWWRR